MRRPVIGNCRAVIRKLEELACTALVEDHGLKANQAAKRLTAELDYYRGLDLAKLTLPQVYRRFCISLANRGSVWNAVFGGSSRFWEMEAAYRRVLHGFNPKRVHSAFEGREDELLEALLAARGLSKEQAMRQRRSPKALFPQYVRGLLAGAEYFSGFKSGPAFARFIDKWLVDPELVVMLPVYFTKLGIPGFGEALAADFLKELGVKELGKPDVWVWRVMVAAEWSTAAYTALEIQRIFWDVHRRMGEAYPPAVVDKLMFVVGSGKFLMVEPTYVCRSRLEEFTAALGQVG